MRAAVPLWLWHIVFLGVLLIVTRSAIVNTVYLALVLFPALAIVGTADMKAVLGSWIVRIALALLVFLWLAPLWTGAIGDTQWPDTTLALVTVASFVMITAHLVTAEPGGQDRVLKALAIVALVITLYSAFTVYRSHWFSDRLAILPWTDPDTGAAVVGLIVTGIAAGPAMSSEEWPGMRMIYWAIAVLLTLSLVMTQSHAAMLGVLIAALACALVRPRTLRGGLLWGGGGVIVAGLILFIFRAPLLGGMAGWSAEMAGFWHLLEGRFWLGFGTQGQVLVWSGGSYLAAPHDMLMTALVHGGVIAAALLAVLIVAMIAFGIRNIRRGLSPAPLAMAVYVAVYGLFATFGVTTPGWQWLTLWLPVGIVAGAEISGRGAAR